MLHSSTPVQAATCCCAANLVVLPTLLYCPTLQDKLYDGTPVQASYSSLYVQSKKEQERPPIPLEILPLGEFDPVSGGPAWDKGCGSTQDVCAITPAMGSCREGCCASKAGGISKRDTA